MKKIYYINLREFDSFTIQSSALELCMIAHLLLALCRSLVIYQQRILISIGKCKYQILKYYVSTLPSLVQYGLFLRQN